LLNTLLFLEEREMKQNFELLKGTVAAFGSSIETMFGFSKESIYEDNNSNKKGESKCCK
jgi:hypothetical protein